MSEWHEVNEANKEDIEIDRAASEVNILVTHNDFGNVYLTLTFDQIKDINAQIEAIEARIEGKV